MMDDGIEEKEKKKKKNRLAGLSLSSVLTCWGRVDHRNVVG